MSVLQIVALLIVAALFTGLMVIKVPVALAMIFASVFGILMLQGLTTGGRTIGAEIFESVANQSLIVVPMFILMGMLIMHAGLAESLFRGLSVLLRRIPGGLGLASIWAAAGFGAVTGSSVAGVATLGKISIERMEKYGYEKHAAAAIVAAAGTLAVLIPPSVALVIYGILTGNSIGALLLAGIIPGIVTGCFFSAQVMLGQARSARRSRQTVTVGSNARPASAVQTASPSRGMPGGEREQIGREEITAVGAIGVIFLIVVGGIYSGLFTATESAAVGALVAVILLVWRRPRKLGKQLMTAFRETAHMTSSIFFLIVGASFLAYFLVLARAPQAFSEWATSLSLPPHLTVALLLLLLLPLGMFLDGISIMVITLPLIYPTVEQLGFDGVWFGIMVVKLIEVGLLTPPVGLNAYVAAGTTPGLRVEGIFKRLGPFIVTDLLVSSVLFAFPALSLFLPGIAHGS